MRSFNAGDESLRAKVYVKSWRALAVSYTLKDIFLLCEGCPKRH